MSEDTSRPKAEDPTTRLAEVNLALARAGADPGDVTHAAGIALMERALDVARRQVVVAAEARAAAYADDMAKAYELLGVYQELTDELRQLRERQEAIIRAGSLEPAARQ